jgi:hypothetical protein
MSSSAVDVQTGDGQTNRTTLSPAAIREADLVQEELQLSPLDVGFPIYQSRTVRQDHAAALKARMLEVGFTTSASKIFVSRAHPGLQCAEGEKPYVVVDGQHRITALRELCQDADDAVASSFKQVPMTVVARSDKEPLSMQDVLVLASTCNQTTQLTIGENADDTIFMVRSYALAAGYKFVGSEIVDPSSSGDAPNNRVVMSISEKAVAAKLLGPKTNVQTVRRYLLTAAALVNFPRVWDHLRMLCGVENAREAFVPSLLVPESFRHAAEDEKVIMMNAVFERFMHLCSTRQRSKAIASPSKFFDNVLLLIRKVRELAEAGGVDEADLFEHSVEPSAFGACSGGPTATSQTSTPALTVSTFIPVIFRAWKDYSAEKDVNARDRLFAGQLKGLTKTLKDVMKGVWKKIEEKASTETPPPRPSLSSKYSLANYAAMAALVFGELSPMHDASPESSSPSTAIRLQSDRRDTPRSESEWQERVAELARSSLAAARAATAPASDGPGDPFVPPPSDAASAPAASAQATPSRADSSGSSSRGDGDAAAGHVASESAAARSQPATSTANDPAATPGRMQLRRRLASGTRSDVGSASARSGRRRSYSTANASDSERSAERARPRKARRTTRGRVAESEDEDQPFDDELLPASEPPADADVGKSLSSILPLEHRARWCLTSADVETLAKDIDESAAHSGRVWATNNLPRVIVYPEITQVSSAAYFLAKSTELDRSGFTVLDRILQDTRAGAELESVISHFITRFRGPAVARAGDDPWELIFNTGSPDATGSGPRYGRLTTPRRWMQEELEKEHPDVFKSKQYVDAVIAGVADKLHLSSTAPGSRLSLPRTGGRLLMTVEHCARQKPHLDFPELPRSRDWSIASEPSYFAIATGADAAVVGVWPASHILTKGPAAVVGPLSERLPHTLQEIPPFSVFIARGDLVHAGAGSDDIFGSLPRDEYDPCNVRYHAYLGREGVPLLDAVHLPSSFKFSW